MQQELIVEVFAESVPAKIQKQTAADFERIMQTALHASGLEPTDVFVACSSSRLVFTAKVNETGPTVHSRRKGPKTTAPAEAVAGFNRSLPANARIETADGYYWAITETDGIPAAELLAGIIPESVLAIPFPQTMAWNTGIKWIRPIRNIMAVFTGKTVDFELGNLHSAGHTDLTPLFARARIMSKPVKSIRDYRKIIGKTGCVLDWSDRRRIIADSLKQFASSGCRVVKDPELLDEVAGLVESPHVFIGQFDEKYLELPREIIQTVIRECQRCFVLEDENGKLLNRFLFASDRPDDDNGGIVQGNERVVEARLADAAYFWEADCRTNLQEFQQKLQGITYFKGLGTMQSRTDRAALLAEKIGIAMNFEPGDIEAVKAAAQHAKLDLCSRLVEEFPSLQGAAGAMLMRESDLDWPEGVLDAVARHNQKFDAELVEDNAVLTALVLADRLERLTGFFRIGKKPKGSADPYQVRRSAVEIVGLLLANSIDLSISKLVDIAVSVDMAEYDKSDEIIRFLLDRVKVVLAGRGIAYDAADASLDAFSSPYAILRKAEFAHAKKRTAEFINAYEAFRRVNRILPAVVAGFPNLTKFTEPAEKKLFRAVLAAEKAVGDELTNESLAALADLRNPVDDFFDNVRVNCADENLKNNRMNLLGKAREVFSRVLQFDRIVME